MPASGNEAKLAFTDFRAAVDLGTALCRILATPLNTLMHYAPGERYAGIPGLLSVPLILIYSVFMAKYDVGPLMCFMGVYIVLAVGWMKYAIYRRKRGMPPIHSRYGGTPYLYLLLRHRGELTEKMEKTLKKIEPFIAMAIGWAVTPFNLPLGLFLMIAALAMGLSFAISEMMETANLLNQIDGMIEQGQMTQAVRRAMGQ